MGAAAPTGSEEADPNIPGREMINIHDADDCELLLAGLEMLTVNWELKYATERFRTQQKIVRLATDLENLRSELNSRAADS